MSNTATVTEYHEDTNTAVYQAEEIEYMIDTGIYIGCPGCDNPVVLSRAVDSGCWEHNCDRGPWNISIVGVDK